MGVPQRVQGNPTQPDGLHQFFDAGSNSIRRITLPVRPRKNQSSIHIIGAIEFTVTILIALMRPQYLNNLYGN
jgi:hypothetical protein